VFTPYPNLETAQTHALEHGLRQKAVAYVTRGSGLSAELLVFDHTPEYPTAGTQVPSGGLEAGETVLEGALRETFEETGLEGLTPKGYLGSGLYANGSMRQVWHCCWLEVGEATTLRESEARFAPTMNIPDSWSQNADDHVFLHRFVPVSSATLHYDFDAFLPKLWERLGFIVVQKAVCYVTRGDNELLVLEGHKDGGWHVVRGNVDDGETPLETAKRELLEEAGLDLPHPVSLGRAVYPLFEHAAERGIEATHRKARQIWQYNFFHFRAPSDTPDSWQHLVSQGSSDGGRTYTHTFHPLETITHLEQNQDALLSAIDSSVSIPPRAGAMPLQPVAVCYITRDATLIPSPSLAGERREQNPRIEPALVSESGWRSEAKPGERTPLELLIFDGHPDGGVQIVAGGIEPGETPLEAARREALEEAGLRLEDGVFLGRHEWHWIGKHPDTHEPLAIHEDRYAFHFHVTEPRDSWEWVVSGGDDDQGRVFRQRFVRLEDVRLDWDLNEFLSQLRADTTGSII
jgi:8-oxo-dGTP diphosphatase